MTTIEELKASYDWKEAFAYASDFTIDDVAEIRNAIEGENDGDDWIIWGLLKNGGYFYLSAGCDFTGWDCQASGKSHVHPTEDELILLGMDRGARERFGLLTPGETV